MVRRACAAEAGLRPGTLVGGRSDDMRRAGLFWLDDLAEGAAVMDALTDIVAAANRAAFGFDLSDFGESAQIARYSAEDQGHFDWHSDIAAGSAAGRWASRRKLTAVIQLSVPDAYEGGALELRPGAGVHEADRAIGTATVFPSFVLHRVTPVTKGSRWSLTLWAHGPAFR
jgi:PKHD-type hydroxylase